MSRFTKGRRRLDTLLVEKGFFISREKARKAIEENLVRIPGTGLLKCSTMVPMDTPIFVEAQKEKYVSRGGYKLAKALRVFNINVIGKKCLDVGSSTGGFVDCLLQFGASKVIAVDVGKGQLDLKLRNDQRVIVLEGVNARYLNEIDLPFKPEIVTVDVSFISLKKIFHALESIAEPEAIFIILIKPQFEAGRKYVESGVVRKKEVHEKVLKELADYFNQNGYGVRITYSPLRGPKGNIEFLFLLEKGKKHTPEVENIIELVNEAHEIFETNK